MSDKPTKPTVTPEAPAVQAAPATGESFDAWKAKIEQRFTQGAGAGTIEGGKPGMRYSIVDNTSGRKAEIEAKLAGLGYRKSGPGVFARGHQAATVWEIEQEKADYLLQREAAAIATKQPNQPTPRWRALEG